MNENNRELLEGLRALAADGPREAPGRIEERLKCGISEAEPASPPADLGACVQRCGCRWNRAVVVGSKRGAETGSADRLMRRRTLLLLSPRKRADGFYPLPEAEALPAVENAMVVRVQLPVSSLQLMGVPVGEERADSSVASGAVAGTGWFGARCAPGAIISYCGGTIMVRRLSLFHCRWIGGCQLVCAGAGTGGSGGGDFALVRAEFGVSNKVVQGAPYSAQAVTQFTQTLANGDHIQRTTTASMARDSQGRTRMDRSISARRRSFGDGGRAGPRDNDPRSGGRHELCAGSSEPDSAVDADTRGADGSADAARTPARTRQRRRRRTWARR